MKKHFLTIAFILFAFAAQSHEIGLRLKKGETYYQNSSTVSNVKQNLNGLEINMNMTMKGKLSFQVTDQKEGYYNMDVRFTFLAMQIEANGMSVKYHSMDNDSENTVSQVLKKMVDVPFQLQMNINGTVREIYNLDNIFTNAMSQISELTESQKEQMMAQLNQAYGEKAFKGNIEMGTAIFPDGPVEVNDKWKNEIQLESGIAALMQNEFQLVKYKKKYAIIEGNAKSQTEDKDAYIRSNGMDTRFDLTGSAKSTYKIDTQTGWVIEAETKQYFSGKAEIADNPQIPGGITIPMTIEHHTITKNK